MQKTLLILAAIILLGGGWYLYNQSQNGALPDPHQTNGEVSELALYFGTELTTPPVDGPVPIEGYDADLLIGRYGGLTQEDFDGVETLQGIYTMENGELIFTQISEPEHSAARTISPEGYETLLTNLKERLDITIENRQDVDALLQLIKG